MLQSRSHIKKSIHIHCSASTMKYKFHKLCQKFINLRNYIKPFESTTDPRENAAPKI